ncbi:hypothetical protein COCNU_03G008940 [Cocos nucifera]|uniref:Uncharacterized protein n=1 Tax=Cocos nucifera TaxID=13894 RepID=A0A8K0I3U6_COCNU|nr:hypothetical protein COCNU_03G008940 [Cocos nucifera]
MAMISKTRNLLEGLVKEGSFKWALGSRSSFDEEFEEMGRSPSGKRKWISELSPMANVIVGRCSRSEPVIMAFPELMGHSRRDYWLAIVQEILYAHRFIRKFQIKGVEKEETLSKAVLGILRLQAIQEVAPSMPIKYEVLLMFNLCDQLPGGDLILETLADMISSRGLDRVNQFSSGSGMHSISALAILSNLGVVSLDTTGERLLVGELVVGQMSSLEKAVSESQDNYKMVEQAKATVEGVKVDGIDTNLAVMKVFNLLSSIFFYTCCW